MIQPHSNHRGLVSRLAAALLAGTLVGPPVAQAETWTSLRGTHSVDAKMVGLWGENVILELSNGRRVTVKLTDLRSESRIQAEALARKLVTSRGERVSALRGQATAASAPAPDPLPVPPAAPDYVPPQPNQASASFFAEFDQAIASGHILAIYDSLPPGYRKDIDDIVKASAQRMDPAAWQGLVGTIHRLGDLIVTRQKWFVSSPRVQALPAEQIAMAEGPLLSFAGLLRVGLDPNAMQLEKLQTMDFRDWLVERDQAMAPYLAQLFKQIGAESLRQVNVESESNGVAVASIDINGAKKKVTYAWVDGYWVPKSLADQWATSVQDWKQSPDTHLAGSVTAASLVLQSISPSLDTLADASSAGSFHEGMESVFTPAQTIVMGVAAMLGRNMRVAGQGNNANGYGYDGGMAGYGDDMSSDYDGGMAGVDGYDGGMAGVEGYDGGMSGAGGGYQAEMMQMQNNDAKYRAQGQNYGQNYGQQGPPTGSQ